MPGRALLALCALVFGAVAAPPRAAAQNNVEVARARQTLEHYTACERTRRFTPCWPLLSRRIQAE